MIKKVMDENIANKCDELLTKLILDERQYNKNIKENFIVKDYFKNIIKNSNNILICYEENNEIVGYVFFKYQENEEGSGYIIDGLFVLEEYRNKGIATLLMKHGLDIVNQKKINYIDINVMVENFIAIKLYESFGFKTYSMKMRKNNS